MRTRNKAASIVVALFCMIGVFAALLYRVDLLAKRRRTATTTIRHDIMRDGNKQYRRTVRIEHSKGSITTIVSFVGPTGGTGKATFIQPDLPRDTRIKQIERMILRQLGHRVHEPMPLPVMVIPHPMEEGENWKVRVVLLRNGMGVEGSGKSPGRARIARLSDLAPGEGPIYGETLHYYPQVGR